jgi:hypothetical protein
LRKRKRDDEEQKRRLDIKAKAKMLKGRKGKTQDKDTIAAKKIIMPEVFISNNMKQQRNYV